MRDTPGRPQHPNRLLSRAREQRAVQLRLTGHTYEQIATALLPCAAHRADNPGGVPDCPDCQPLYRDRSSAHKAVTKVLLRDYTLDEQTKAELRAEHLASLRLLQQRATRAAVQGDWEAARVALRSLDHQAKVLGLYAPTRFTVNSELDSEIAALIEQLGGPTPTPQESHDG